MARSSMYKHQSGDNVGSHYVTVKKKGSFMNMNGGSKLIQESPYATAETPECFNPMNGSIYRKQMAPPPN